MNTGIFFSLEKLHGELESQTKQINGSENREKLGDYLKWTDYSDYINSRPNIN